jgi:hypothetical protein
MNKIEIQNGAILMNKNKIFGKLNKYTQLSKDNCDDCKKIFGEKEKRVKFIDPARNCVGFICMKCSIVGEKCCRCSASLDDIDIDCLIAQDMHEFPYYLCEVCMAGFCEASIKFRDNWFKENMNIDRRVPISESC